MAFDLMIFFPLLFPFLFVYLAISPAICGGTDFSHNTHIMYRNLTCLGDVFNLSQLRFE